MHDTAYRYCELFYNTYVKDTKQALNVVEIGSQDVNGSLKPIFNNPLIRYTGVDYVEGNNVDIVLKEPYVLPFKDASVDVIISSSCLEHTEMFWMTFLEMMRILRPDGLLYINVPSKAGPYHRYPVDCWRFYPDSGRALQVWGKRCGVNCALIESFVGHPQNDGWEDFVGVYIRDESFINQYPNRIINSINDYDNGFIYNSDEILNHIR